MTDVFVSYKRSERHRVYIIEQCLKAEDLSVWFDIRLELGRSEGFAREIEREVSSASSVMVCWTPDATRSNWVLAEAMRGLERNCLVPVLLERLSVPVPFNAVETVDLSGWAGDQEDPRWKRVVEKKRSLKDAAALDLKSRMSKSAAAYEALENEIFPGTMGFLCKRIEALHPLDAERYSADIDVLMSWFETMFEKQAQYHQDGYNHAKSLSDGGKDWEVAAWRYWDSGRAQARAAELAQLIERFERINDALRRSKKLLSLSSP